MQSFAVRSRVPRSSHFPAWSEAQLTWYDAKKSENTARILSVANSHRSLTTQTACRFSKSDTELSPTRPLIAVVDDEPVIAITLAEILIKHGFDAVWFSVPNEALDFFRDCRVDLLLSDVSMPVMDGIYLAAAILELSSDCAIFLLSARSHESELRRRVRLLDADVHLEAKPIQVHALVATIRHILANT
jgi:CheY-like chemotaxis protein